MTTLHVIRHGQASFGQRNYDKLSERGEEQARIAGRALREQGFAFDALIAGDMRRQVVTAERAAEAFDAPPAIEQRTAFNEYSAESLFAAYLPRVLADNPELAARRDALFTDRRVFQQAFAAVTDLWRTGAPHSLSNFESWVGFRDRVRAGLAGLHADFGRDARLALFTSGGPIAVAVGSALGADDAAIIGINWTVYNASISEFRSTRRGWRLMSFNSVGHLRRADPALVTHR